VHELELDVENVPAGQILQLLPSQKLPGAQVEHEVENVAENVPAGQGKQVVYPPLSIKSPGAGEYVFSEHG
jgi:hypothetical protein